MLLAVLLTTMCRMSTTARLRLPAKNDLVTGGKFLIVLPMRAILTGNGS